MSTCEFLKPYGSLNLELENLSVIISVYLYIIMEASLFGWTDNMTSLIGYEIYKGAHFKIYANATNRQHENY